MTSTKTSTMKFDSEGFDLDAAVSNINLVSSQNNTTSSGRNHNEAHEEEEEEVIYEIGGGVATTTTTTANTTTTVSKNDAMLQKAESLKEQGNEYYKKQDYTTAYDKYTAAIRTIEEGDEEEKDLVATVGDTDDKTSSINAATTTETRMKTKVMTGPEILKKKDLWEQEQHLRLRNELRQRDSQKDDHSSSTAEKNPSTTESSSSSSTSPPPPPPQFVLDPPHPYGTILATYYCNRAAASMQIAASESTTPKPTTTTTTTSESRSPSAWYDHDDDTTTNAMKKIHPKDQEAVQDCTIAILLNPNYTKAYIRRATIYEQRYHPYTNHHTELALQDMMTAQSIEPNNRTVSTHVRRLQQLEQERMEIMKQETLSKLKDLGNSILGNFGLSLDNFKTQQDPNTGSYNISFSQN